MFVVYRSGLAQDYNLTLLYSEFICSGFTSVEQILETEDV
jgi:hypothetical protein